MIAPRLGAPVAEFWRRNAVPRLMQSNSRSGAPEGRRAPAPGEWGGL